MSSKGVTDNVIQQKKILTKQVLDTMKETTRDLEYLKNSIDNQLKFFSNFLVVPDKDRNNPKLSSLLKGIFSINREHATFHWKLEGDTLLARYIKTFYNSNAVIISLGYDTNRGVHISLLTSNIAKDPLSLKLASDKEINMLKFLPRKTLCFMMRYINSKLNFFNDETEVSLDATPSLSTGSFKDPKKLLVYYYELGFVLEDNRTKENYISYINENLENSITMISNMKTILNNCSSFDIDIKNIEIDIINNIRPLIPVVLETKQNIKDEINDQNNQEEKEDDEDEDDSFEGLMKMNQFILSENLFKEKKETLEHIWKNILKLRSKYTDRIDDILQRQLERKRNDNPYYNRTRDDYKYERMLINNK
jgi:hypothetical protein